MGTIGFTYGSEWHLLRYLGYHRDELNRLIEEIIPGKNVKVESWLDFHFEEKRPVANLQPPVICPFPRILDAERTGYDFLPPGQLEDIPAQWSVYFPPGHGGTGPQHWDAVGKILIDGEEHWLIVEAKAHLGELRANCGARPDSQALIQTAFQEVKAGWNEVPVANWFGPYYQFCNRIAFLHFLRSRSIKAKVLFIYFCGDRHPPGRTANCPVNEAGWAFSLAQMEAHVGWLNQDNPFAANVHKLFLPVCPPPTDAVLRRREPR
jgi:hypothetical protein